MKLITITTLALLATIAVILAPTEVQLALLGSVKLLARYAK